MRQKTLIGATLALLFLAGCGSSGLDDILGGGSTTAPATFDEVRGTVDYVDTQSRFVQLRNVATYRNRLANDTLGSGTDARVYFDDRTTVQYQGSQYRPADLERGDQVAARVDDVNGRLFAETMTVLYDSSSGTTSGSASTAVSTLRGTVNWIDTARRLLTLDQTSWIRRFDTGAGTGSGTVTIQYGTNTPVMFQGQVYSTSNLERGDVVDVDVRQSGNTLEADRITVVRDVNTRY